MILVSLLVIAVALALLFLFIGKGSTTTPGSFISPLARGPRYRDGGVTYRQLDGIRFGFRVENPYEPHTARYERRHRPKKHTSPYRWAK